MTPRRLAARAAVVLALTTACLVGLRSPSAAAHPLGNFSVNHLDRLTFRSDRLIDDAVVDAAEIPTAQAAGAVDADGDGVASPAELSAWGATSCAAVSGRLTLTAGPNVVAFTVTSSRFSYVPGQAGLNTSRLECGLEARADLTTPQQVAFEDHYLPDRVGWHEITARGDGVQLADSPVPQTSITDDLTNYPVDLLSSPLAVRSAVFDLRPGPGASTVSADAQTGTLATGSGFFSGTVSRVQGTFNDLIGRRQLTLSVGLLAIALALLLGASHAALPGHGKTVMAAYIAGRQGSMRDAIVVGATVTATHTGGVLVLGTALTLSTALAGEAVLGWLGVSSGVLVAGLGVALLISAVRNRRTSGFAPSHRHDDDDACGQLHAASPPPHRHRHGHGHEHHHHWPGHGHHHVHHDGFPDHQHDHEVLGHEHATGFHASGQGRGRTASGSDDWSSVTDVPILVAATAHHAGLPASEAPAVAGSTTTPRVDPVGRSSAATETVPPLLRPTAALEQTGPDRPASPSRVSRRGLVGMGIAGGLVPSPSALIILLSAIALGRTWFGILLVLSYGVGMAATLTAAGVLLVAVRDRYQRRNRTRPGRASGAARWWGRIAPFCTASLVAIVGIGLALRSLASL